MQFNQQKPIYLQIADYIIDQILSGNWIDGSRIPSIRDMAIEMEVNPNTVTRTYAYLQEQDVISIQRGIGYFTNEQAAQKVRSIRKKEFIREGIPELIHTMRLIHMSIEEFNDLYNQYNSGSKLYENE
jgi:DNA-binding transcriptional regulator YhcF (GntR family)